MRCQSQRSQAANLVMLNPALAIKAAVLDRLRNALRGDLLGPGKVRNSPCDLKYPNKDLLYVEHAYPEFVPTVTINWAELEAMAV